MFSLTTILYALPLVSWFGAALAAPLSSHNNATVPQLQRRFSGHATYYQTGLGACGQYNNPGDWIVALNSAQYGGGYPGPQCFKMLTITYRGKKATAQVVDECPTCNYGSLDFSQGLFEYFEPTSVGMFPMTWEWGTGGGDPEPEPTTSKKPKPTPTPTPTPTPEEKPTSTSRAPETTPSPTPSSSSSAVTSDVSSLLSGSSTVSGASASGSGTSTGPAGAQSTGTAKAGDGKLNSASGSNIADINQLVLQIGQTVINAASLG